MPLRIRQAKEGETGRGAGRTIDQEVQALKSEMRPGLRWVCWRAALSLLRHNPVFREAYQRWTQRAEHSLTKMEALGACMHKLLRVMYAIARESAAALPATTPTPPGDPVPALGRRLEVA